MRRKRRADRDMRLQRVHWGHYQSLEIVRRLNARCLQWLARVAAEEGTHPLEMFRYNRDLWKVMDSRACLRAARVPIVLMNCNFQYADWWLSVASHGVPPIHKGDNYRRPIADDAQPMLREVLTEARTIAVSEPIVAILVLGAPSDAIKLLASLTVPDIDRISINYVHEMRPRWAERTAFWRDLLSVSIGETEAELSDLYCHSLQLLGSDLLVDLRSG